MKYDTRDEILAAVRNRTLSYHAAVMLLRQLAAVARIKETNNG